MKSSLTFRIGAKARKSLLNNGLHPNSVKVIAGAAGGPKWLMLSQMDRFLFGEWLKPRKEPLHLIGSSIGSWRFAAASQKDPVAGINRFEEAYFSQTYSKKPTLKEVDDECIRILNLFVDSNDIQHILNHPFLRLNILTVSCKNIFKSDNKHALLAGMAMATGLNAVHPKLLKVFFERAAFVAPKEQLPLFNKTPHKFMLSQDNFKKALLASGSIPGVMSAMNSIEDTSLLSFRDGGILDYHMNLPLMDQVGEEDLVLFPHYTSRVLPNWFDKAVPWRKHSKRYFENTVLVSPSKEFVASLPLAKIPDRNDFKLFIGRDNERIAYWTTVLKECERLRDDLRKVFESGRIPHSEPL